jgi:hypothetical protein
MAEELQEQEFFSSRDPAIAGAANAAARKRAIAALKDTNPALLAEFREASRKAQGQRHLLAATGRFPLCARGRINTYAVFAEATRDAIAGTGRVGIIVPSGIATDDTTKYFFSDLVETRTLRVLYDFENQGTFKDVHSSYKFCILTVGGRPAARGEQIDFSFFAHSASEAMDPSRRFSMSPDDIMLLNPNTGTCPVFRSERDAEIAKGIYRRVPVLIREAREGQPESNPWGITLRQGLFNMASDSGLFRSRRELEDDGWALKGDRFQRDESVFVPLYEAKMTSLYDHRHGNVVGAEDLSRMSGIPAVATTPEQHRDPRFCTMPRYWVPEQYVQERVERTGWHQRYFIAFRDLARSTDARTAIHSVLPWAGVNHKTPLILPFGVEGRYHAALLAVLNSFVYDYLVRQKIGGSSVSFFIVKQCPVLPPSRFDDVCPWNTASETVLDWVAPRVLELVYNSHNVSSFAHALDYEGPPFIWDEERRFQIRCEVDAAMCHLYQLDANEAACILDSFPVVRRYDAERHGGVYRSKDTILAIYGEMAEAQRTGEPFVSALNPPPGPPADAHGHFIPLAQWDDQTGQRYQGVIHPPREAELRPAATTTVGTRAPVGAGGFPDNERDRLLVAAALALVGAHGIDEETACSSRRVEAAIQDQ